MGSATRITRALAWEERIRRVLSANIIEVMSYVVVTLASQSAAPISAMLDFSQLLLTASYPVSIVTFLECVQMHLPKVARSAPHLLRNLHGLLISIHRLLSMQCWKMGMVGSGLGGVLAILLTSGGSATAGSRLCIQYTTMIYTCVNAKGGFRPSPGPIGVYLSEWEKLVVETS